MFTTNVQTSGTYNYFPSTAEIIVSAFSRLAIRRAELTEVHMSDAIMEFNAFLASFNDVGPNLAQVDLVTIPLIQGTATYTMPQETVMVLDVIIRYGNPAIDRYIFSISRSEYVAIPNKTNQGVPNQYWFDRLASPTITLYFVPDGNGPYQMLVYRFRQVQDAIVTGGIQPEVPNRAIDCLIAGLAYRLSRIYAPQIEDKRKMDAAEAWAIYAKQDTENANMYITPSMSGYWRT